MARPAAMCLFTNKKSKVKPMPASRVSWLFVLLGSIITLIPVFYNGFPFVYSDTGAYIHHGFEGTVPGDRPFMYGFLIRHISLATSLWFVAVFQALVINYFVFRLINFVLGSTPKNCINYCYISTCIFLNVFTSLPWFAGLILPDIFTSVTAIILVLILFEPKLNSYLTALDFVLLIVFSETHLSNIIVSVLLSASLLSLKLLFKQSFAGVSLKRIVMVLVLSILNIYIVKTIHYFKGGGFTTSKYAHLFLVAKLTEEGVLKPYLDEACKDKEFNICLYKDSLPQNSPEFLWNPNSVLYQLGGWDANANEYKTIVSQIFSSPKWVWMYGKAAAVSSFNQFLLQNYREELIPYNEGSSPYISISWRFKHDVLPYQQSIQQTQGIDINEVRQKSVPFAWMVYTSLTLLFLLAVRNRFNGKLYLSFVVIFLFYVFNSAVTASLATVTARYTSRMSWLFVLFALMLLWQLFIKFHQKNHEQTSNKVK